MDIKNRVTIEIFACCSWKQIVSIISRVVFHTGEASYWLKIKINNSDDCPRRDCLHFSHAAWKHAG